MWQIVDKIQGGKLVSCFNYEVDKKRRYKAIHTPIAPDKETMRYLLDRLMMVEYILTVTDGEYITIYEIKHSRLTDYEWEEIE